MSQLTSTARSAADKARTVIAKVRPGPTDGRRSLPIRRAPQDIEARWAERRDDILAGIPVADAQLEIGDEDRDWGHTVTLRLQLTEAVPGMATQALTGKAVRRLKALCETGEIPTTDFNPAAREDAGEPSGEARS
jgi:hypothetical protein